MHQTECFIEANGFVSKDTVLVGEFGVARDFRQSSIERPFFSRVHEFSSESATPKFGLDIPTLDVGHLVGNGAIDPSADRDFDKPAEPVVIPFYDKDRARRRRR